mgnify:CR=1 FL=1
MTARTKLTYGGVEQYLENAGPLDMPEGETFTISGEWVDPHQPVPITLFVEGDEANAVTVELPYDEAYKLFWAQKAGAKATLTATGKDGRTVTITLDPATGEAS